MEETLKENYILLSKIAKEKKYAQEYLGLLARRGDIGSIRIGKRWYTTWQWFEEFLKNSQKKKVENSVEVKEEKIEMIEQRKETVVEEKSEVKISLPFVVPVKEPELVAVKAMSADVSQVQMSIEPKAESAEIKIRVPQKAAPVVPAESKIVVRQPASEQVIRKEVAQPVCKSSVTAGRRLENRVPLRIRTTSGEIKIQRSNEPKHQAAVPARKVSVEERNRNAVPYHEVKLKRAPGVFSPPLQVEEKTTSFFFPRLAYAASFAMMILLVAGAGYFVFSSYLSHGGTVAGASDQRVGEVSSIKASSDTMLAGAGDKMKESLSISRIVVEVAKESEMKTIAATKRK